jgi:hypothetical protein
MSLCGWVVPPVPERHTWGSPERSQRELRWTRQVGKSSDQLNVGDRQLQVVHGSKDRRPRLIDPVTHLHPPSELPSRKQELRGHSLTCAGCGTANERRPRSLRRRPAGAWVGVDVGSEAHHRLDDRFAHRHHTRKRFRSSCRRALRSKRLAANALSCGPWLWLWPSVATLACDGGRERFLGWGRTAGPVGIMTS